MEPSTTMKNIFHVIIACLFLSVAVTAQAAGSFSEKLGKLLGNNTPQEEEILDPDDAFIFSSDVAGPGIVLLRWDIEDGYYLYRDNFRFAIDVAGVKPGAALLPPGKMKEDPDFGNVEVYYRSAEIRLPLLRNNQNEQEINLTVTYQGCKEDTICYPPVNKTIPLILPAVAAGTDAANISTSVIPEIPAVISEQDAISRDLQDKSLPGNMLVFLGFGLLLAFTPCIFPMIPILSGIIVGHGHKITSWHAFMLSLVYVLAMSATYAVLGVIAGSFSFNLQAASQNVWVITAFSGVFVLLALSMFGFYELQLPASWQTRLNEFGNKQKHGSLMGAGVMGVLSAIIVGPCVAPPLAGALIYISQTGDAILGGAALFALGIGMGAPLLVIGSSAGKLLPRAGEWMVTIKKSFGVVMLGVAIWFMERVLPGPVTLLLWSALIIVTALYMGALDSLMPGARWQKLWKGLGIIMLVYGVILVIGAASGGNDVFRPLQGIAYQTETAGKLSFEKIKTVADLDRKLADAEFNNRPVMLDFYADWCITCKEMEKYTFSDPVVHAALQDMVLLKADVTANDEQDQALLKRFGIIGPPAILFFVRGEEHRGYRLAGFLKAGDFVEHIKQVSMQ
jgi:thiol:disulfide interchange protein DsbD